MLVAVIPDWLPVLLMGLILAASVASVVYGRKAASASEQAARASTTQLKREDVDVKVGFMGPDGTWQQSVHIRPGEELTVMVANFGSTKSPEGTVHVTLGPPGSRASPSPEWEPADSAPGMGPNSVGFKASLRPLSLHGEGVVGSFDLPQEDFTQLTVYWAVEFDRFSGGAAAVHLSRQR